MVGCWVLYASAMKIMFNQPFLFGFVPEEVESFVFLNFGTVLMMLRMVLVLLINSWNRRFGGTN